MRGDSVRDLYAKTLAVLGLGLLAGAGAAVDYWPVGAPLPNVKVAALPAPVVPILTQHLDRQVAPPVFAEPVPVRVMVRTIPVGRAALMKASFAPPPPLPVVATPLAMDPNAMAIADPPPPVPVDEQLPELLAATGEGAVWLAAPPVSTQEASGFIGGALKKTKDSIIRTSARTGASIADAFRGVFGAFKKVSPF